MPLISSNVNVPLVEKGQEKAVLAAKIAIDLVDVNIIGEKAFYHYNFRLFRNLTILT